MIYRDFNGIKLSAIGLGNMRLPVMADVEGKPIDREKAGKIIDLSIENGINYFDTAHMYHSGESEPFLGDALKEYDRASYYLATKYPIFMTEDYKGVFEKQLCSLKTDYIDFYLIHSVSDSIYQKLIDCGAIEYFLQQQKLGKIKYLGFSSHASVKALEVFASHHKWDFAQIQLNYFDWYNGTAQQEYDVLRSKDIPIMVMEPVRGGRLASLSSDAAKILTDIHPDWSLAKWAFGFVKSLDGIKVILSGMSDVDQLNDNLATFSSDVPLSQYEHEALKAACEAFKNQVTVPCTGCRYCCDGCPAGINIPEILEVYNEYNVSGPYALGQLKNISGGTCRDCISCGACTSHCPQGIDVPSIMSMLSDLTK